MLVRKCACGYSVRAEVKKCPEGDVVQVECTNLFCPSGGDKWIPLGDWTHGLDKAERMELQDEIELRDGIIRQYMCGNKKRTCAACDDSKCCPERQVLGW